MLQIKTKTLKEMKNIFDGLLSRLDTAEKWISELKDIARESLKTEKQKEQRLGGKNRISKDFGVITKGIRSDQIRSVTQSCPTLQPHESQHARPPCPSPTSGVHSDSHPSSQWCHPAISSSVVPFSSCLQSFPASGSFLMSQFFASGGQVLEFQLQHQSFQWKFRTDFL